MALRCGVVRFTVELAHIELSVMDGCERHIDGIAVRESGFDAAEAWNTFLRRRENTTAREHIDAVVITSGNIDIIAVDAKPASVSCERGSIRVQQRRPAHSPVYTGDSIHR